MSIKLLIADDQAVVRAGLNALLQGTEIEIVAQASSGAETVRAATQSHPDVALVDVVMPGGDGLAALARLRAECPQLPVVMYSGYDNPTFVNRAAALGAAGFVLKGAGPDALLQAIRRAAEGKTSWNRERLRRTGGELAVHQGRLETDPPLTNRESQVLEKLTAGKTNKEIAQELRISYETVKEHVQHILRKIGVTDRTQAAIWAERRSLQ